MPIFHSIEKIEELLEELEKTEKFDIKYMFIVLSLLKDEILNNENTKTQIKAAICLSRLISRSYVKNLFSEESKERVMYVFIDQLQKLDPNSQHYEEYCDFLQIANNSKAFASCELDNEEIQNRLLDKLFAVVFNLIETNLEENVNSELLSILKSVLEQKKNVHFGLLHKIFTNIINPVKKSHKKTYIFTKNLISSLKSKFEGFLKSFIYLIKEESNELKCYKIISIAYELRNICPKVVEDHVLNYAISNLSLNDKEVLIISLKFIGKLFSLEDSNLVFSKSQAFLQFFERLKDIDEDIRVLTSKYVSQIFLNHPEIRVKIKEKLKILARNPRPEIRSIALYCICEVIFENIQILQEDEFFVNFLKRMNLDPEFSVREMELISVSLLYEEYIDKFLDLSPEIRKCLLIIQSKVLYTFANKRTHDDKILIQKLFQEYFVPYNLPATDRMKRLFYFYSSLQMPVLKPFEDLELELYKNRKLLQKFIKLVKVPEERENLIEEIIRMISANSGVIDSISLVEKFESFLKIESLSVDVMEKLSDPNTSCEEAVKILKIIKKVLKQVESGDKFCEIIESGASLILDHESIGILIDYVFEALDNGPNLKEFDLDPEIAGERGINLLRILAKFYIESFQLEGILEKIVNHLSKNFGKTRALMIYLLEIIGKEKPLHELLSESNLEVVFRTCENLAIEGTSQESEASVKCLKNTIEDIDQVYNKILQDIEKNLVPSSKFFLGSIVALGCIVAENPEGKTIVLKHLILKVLDFLKNYERSETSTGADEKEWYEEDELAMNLKCFEASIICVKKYVYFCEIDSYISENCTNFLNRLVLIPFTFSAAINNRSLAVAACAILKLCEIVEFRASLEKNVFYHLSELMNHKCREVTEYFLSDLIHLLANGSPPRFLTNEFLALFIALEEENKFYNTAYKEFERIIDRRNHCINYVFDNPQNASKQLEIYKKLSDWIPEHSVMYGLLILAHDPSFKDFNNLDHKDLKILENRLWKFLQPIVAKSRFNCFDLFEKIGEQLKEFGDAESPSFNKKLWIVNEILLKTIKKRIKSKKGRIFEVDLNIPLSHFEKLSYQESLQNQNLSFAVAKKLLKKK